MFFFGAFPVRENTGTAKIQDLLLVCRACHVAREHVSHELGVCVAQGRLFYEKKKTWPIFFQSNRLQMSFPQGTQNIKITK